MRSGPYFMKSRGDILISLQPKNSTYSPGTLADGNLRFEWLDLPPHHLEIRYPEMYATTTSLLSQV